MSETRSSTDETRARRRALRWNHDTASSLSSSRATSSSGWPTQRRSSRPPIDVLVRSSTESREADRSPHLPPSNSSRFLRVWASSTM